VANDFGYQNEQRIAVGKGNAPRYLKDSMMAFPRAFSTLEYRSNTLVSIGMSLNNGYPRPYRDFRDRGLVPFR